MGRRVEYTHTRVHSRIKHAGGKSMIHKLLSKLFGGTGASAAEAKFVGDGEGSSTKAVDPLDPLDPKARAKPWPEDKQAAEVAKIRLRPATDFPTFDGLAGDELPAAKRTAVADAAVAVVTGKAAMDDSAGEITLGLKGQDYYGVPPALGNWFGSQGFIGYQACAILAQHWLVDKACSMAGEDAVRNGWLLSTPDGEDLDKEEHDKLIEADKGYKIKENLVEFNRFKNIFGIRIAIFKVKSNDPLYYEKPFNPDGCGPGCYQGISQVDPYWMTPVLSSNGANDPSEIGFYDPQYWVINGKKYHISHLAISRGPQPADILKPTYIFGGVSLAQRIYERVYAAERTANESPLLAMSKRTTAIHVDVDQVLADQCAFEERLAMWIKYRDNHGVKVLGKEEMMEQFDTALADFDSIIMNQYQIVAAIARVPATKLLGTSPKGFNATGEFEMKNYHEELESTNEHVMMPMLERHYMLSARSLGIKGIINIVMNPVDSVTAKERAELNQQKSQTGIELINAGVISPEEERQRLIDDEHSGYDRLEDASEAESQPGMSPENLADLEKAGAASTAAQNPGAGAAPGRPGIEALSVPSEGAPDASGHAAGATPQTLEALALTLAALATKPKPEPSVSETALAAILALLTKQMGSADQPASMRGTSASTRASVPASSRAQDGEIVKPMAAHRMPKLRLHGLNCFIENPKGTVRTGTDIDGTEWACEMPDHYGFIKGYEGADGDDVDCFIGSDLRAKEAYVVVQNCPETGEFDEYKIMIGYPSLEAAVDTYHAAYGDNWKGFNGVLAPMSIDELKGWLDSGAAAQEPDGFEYINGGDFTGDKAEFKESDHPRAENGQFGSGGGGAAKAPAAKPKAAPKPAPKPAAAPARSEGAAALVPAGENRETWPDHIKALKLPPGWTDVRINPNKDGSLLAIGRDAKGRNQPVYSNAFRATKAAEKFGRVKAMAEEFATMSNKVAEDQKSADPKTRASADAMRLVMNMGLRPGSDNDTGAEKKAHGASNLEARHVQVDADGSVRLEFTGKKGVSLNLPVSDPDIAAMLKQRKAAAGGDDGRLFPGVTDVSMRDYSHSLGSGSFKTKDFRTYTGTSNASKFIQGMEAPTDAKSYKAAVKDVATRVSKILGNTPSIALESYISPTVFAEWKSKAGV